MDYLNELGIKKEIIMELNNFYSSFEIDNLLLDQKKVTNNILLLKKLGLKNIDYLLLYKLPFFFCTKEQILKTLGLKESIENTITKLNNDFKYIDYIYS